MPNVASGETCNNSSSKKRHSASLTRNGERRDKKRSRTRSTDLAKQQQQQQQHQQQQSGGGGITAITTLKIGEDGKPITVTSEIKHDTQLNKMEVSIRRNNNNNGNKPSTTTTTTTTTASSKPHRKKRPSREFLQRSMDESLSCTDSAESDVFWNGSEALIEEVAASSSRPPMCHQPAAASAAAAVHIMTPIVETGATPLNPNQAAPHSRLYSNSYNVGAKNRQHQMQQMTPTSAALVPSMTPSHTKTKPHTHSIPLARKYKRAHSFKGQVILNSELCAHCDKRTKFGKMIMKCRECDMVVHAECRELLQRPCYPMSSFAAQGVIGDYVSTAADERPRVPPVIQMVVSEIEARGLLTHEVGLYRVNGSDSQIKQLKERLVKRHQPPDLRKISDVHVLCSFLKDFLNNFLTEHLVTYDAWFRFAKACGKQLIHSFYILPTFSLSKTKHGTKWYKNAYISLFNLKIESI